MNNYGILYKNLTDQKVINNQQFYNNSYFFILNEIFVV